MKTCLAALFLVTLAVPAQASLVFDEVLIGFYSGDIDSPTGGGPPPQLVTVVAGPSDDVVIHSYAHVNVDPTSIYVRFDPPSQQKWGKIGSFNGLKITGLDWSGAKEALRFTVDTNMVEELCAVCPPHTDPRVIVGDNFVAFDWRSYLYTAESYFDVRIRPVPEPNGLAMLFAGLETRRTQLRGTASRPEAALRP